MSPAVGIPGEIDAPRLAPALPWMSGVARATSPGASALDPVASDHLQQIEPSGDGAPSIGPNSPPAPGKVEALRKGSLSHAAHSL
eukprot:15446124-Alexandrium_andersonii.AAC.1